MTTASRDSATKPVISIVTVTYNAETAIPRTLASVIEQDYPATEFIIIDGASTDRTLVLIEEQRERIDQLVSEPDNGIYDAMNKGAQLARGEWLVFMNAGDIFAGPDTLSRLHDKLGDDIDLLYGDTDIDFGHYRIHQRAKDFGLLWKGTVCTHQAMLCRRCRLLEHPFLGEDYPICADYEFTLWLAANGKGARQVGQTIAIMDGFGVSRSSMVRTVLGQYSACRRYHRGLRLHGFYLYRLLRAWLRSQIKRLLPETVVARLRGQRP